MWSVLPSCTRVWISALDASELAIPLMKVRSIFSASAGNWRRYASEL